MSSQLTEWFPFSFFFFWLERRKFCHFSYSCLAGWHSGESVTNEWTIFTVDIFCRSITGQCGNLCVTLSLYSFKLNLKFKYYHMPDYTEHVFTLPGITLFALAMVTWIIGCWLKCRGVHFFFNLEGTWIEMFIKFCRFYIVVNFSLSKWTLVQSRRDYRYTIYQIKKHIRKQIEWKLNMMPASSVFAMCYFGTQMEMLAIRDTPLNWRSLTWKLKAECVYEWTDKTIIGNWISS